LGRALRTADGTGTPADLAAALGGALLGHGRIVDVVTSPRTGRFDVTTVSVVDEATGAVIRLEAENEFVIALADGRPVATAPDLIAVIAVPGTTVAGARVLLVDDARPGARVVVLSLDAPAWWTATPERLAAVSPA
ncbi:S-methyl thiohydantoin desulfurase domain-containing protein, partial [Clavibacter phaseoli]